MEAEVEENMAFFGGVSLWQNSRTSHMQDNLTIFKILTEGILCFKIEFLECIGRNSGTGDIQCFCRGYVVGDAGSRGSWESLDFL